MYTAVAVFASLALASVLAYRGFLAYLAAQKPVVFPGGDRVEALEKDLPNIAARVDAVAKAIAQDLESMKGRIAAMEVAHALRGKR